MKIKKYFITKKISNQKKLYKSLSKNYNISSFVLIMPLLLRNRRREQFTMSSFAEA